MAVTLIADDLTGACDAGALFAGRGPVGVVTASLDHDDAAEALAVDTESRARDAPEAAKAVWDAARRFLGRFAEGVAFKKIDSTLRGQVAAEIGALLAAGGFRAALVCPSFPGQGRTVVDGFLRVHGTLAHRSPVGQDPFYPGETSSLVEILGAGDRPVRHLPLREVRQAPEKLQRALEGEAEEVIAADAETNADLDTLARATLELPDLVLVGSAGLAGAASRALGYAAAPPPLPRARAWFVVAGSLHPATRAQLAALESAGVARAWADAHREPDVGPVAAALESGRPAFLATRPLDASAEPEDWALMAAELGAAAARVLERVTPEVLVAIGGDTAWALLGAIGARRLDLLGAPLEGLALGELGLDSGERVLLITKAGGFGPPHLLLGLVRGTA
jgi:uncharacterized protein YgbK (DUF1537 family)